MVVKDLIWMRISNFPCPKLISHPRINRRHSILKFAVPEHIVILDVESLKEQIDPVHGYPICLKAVAEQTFSEICLRETPWSPCVSWLDEVIGIHEVKLVIVLHKLYLNPLLSSRHINQIKQISNKS